MKKETLSSKYEDNRQILNERLRLSENFDLIGREIRVAGRRAVLYFIDGFTKDDIMEKLMELLMVCRVYGPVFRPSIDCNSFFQCL